MSTTPEAGPFVATDLPAEVPKGKVGIGLLPGGELPDVGKILTETFSEFGENIGPYAMAGLGHFLVMMPIIFVTIMVGYLVLFGGMIGTMAIGSVLSVMISETLGSGLGDIGILLTSILSVVVPILMFVGLLAFVGA